jgi:chitinase
MLRFRASLLSLAFLLPVFCAAAAAKAPRPVVAGYVFTPNAALLPGAIDAASLTRVNYAFAVIKEGRMVAGSPADSANLAVLTALRRRNPSLEVLVSVGGWLGSAGFSDVALTPESRRVFIESAMDLLRHYDLDGLDIDWEYPGMAGAGHPFRGEDKQNFTLLLQDLRKRFDQESKKSHRRLCLTIAAGASGDYLAHVEMGKAQKYVDAVNLMAYDYIESGSAPLTGHHAPLYANPADARHHSADASVRALEQAGVPAAKLLLGLPFYGHVWGEVADRDHGLFQPGKPVPHDYAPYSLIAATMLDHGFVRYWDSAASAPYLYNPETRIFVSYEDPESIAAKSRYVLAHKLGGVMFWDESSDPAGTLLGAINQTLRGRASKK